MEADLPAMGEYVLWELESELLSDEDESVVDSEEAKTPLLLRAKAATENFLVIIEGAKYI